jgi:hypothetical protein
MQIKQMKSQCIEIEGKKINSKDQIFDTPLMHTIKSFQEKKVDHFCLGLHTNSLPSK